MLVREFEECDRERLRRIYFESRRATFNWLATSAYTLADFDADTKDERILVAVNDKGDILGFASIWMPDNFIHHLYVSPEALGRGVGKALLNAATSLFVLPLRLKCMQANRKALEFYRSQGWRIQSEGADEQGPYYNLISW